MKSTAPLVCVDNRDPMDCPTLASRARLWGILYEFAVKADLESAAHNDQAALTSRAVIDQAKGIIMATRACSAPEAFEILVSMSSRQNRKLRDVAAQLVTQAARGEVRARTMPTWVTPPTGGFPELGEPTV